MSASPDPDLRDVFQLLYGEDDTWGDFDGDGEGEGSEVDAVEADVAPDLNTKYTRKRFRELLDDVFQPYSQPPKRQRIYTPPCRPALLLTPIASTSALPPLPTPDTYAPFSPYALLARLLTFTPAALPSQSHPSLSPVKLARNGWACAGRETLRCGMCRSSWSTRGLEAIRDDKVRNEVAKRLGDGAPMRHRPDCAWRIRDTSEDVPARLLRLVHPLVSSSLAPLAERLQLECLAEGPSIRWKSPLSEKQLTRLTLRLDAYVHPDVPESAGTPLDPLTQLATALAVFAWYPYHPKSSAPLQITPATPPRRTEVVQCRICQRRVGLWAFKSDEQRELDVYAEHLGWCPVRRGGWWNDAGIFTDHDKFTGGSWIALSPALEKKPWQRA